MKPISLLIPPLAALCVFVGIQPANGQTFLTNGLVAYYPFNGNANDVAGTNNGVVHGATLTTDRFGVTNAAFSFNGATAYIQTQYPMQDLSNATFSAWINPYKVSASQGVFLSDSIPIPGDSWACDIVPAGTNAGIYITGHTPPGAGNGYTITNGVGNFTEKMTDNWYQFVWVMQPTTQQVFINGVLVVNVNTNMSDIGGHANGFVFGADSSASPYYKFYNGQMSNVRIYNRLLSTNEVQQLYDSESKPIVTLKRAVYLSFSNLFVGTNYQLQVSGDLSKWTDQGAAFTATNSTIIYPEYLQVEDWNELFFRVQAVP